MFANAFFSSFFFPSFFRSFFLLFLEIKHARLPPHRHYKKTQAGHLTGINKLVQTYHSTGLRQTHKLIAPQAAKLQAWHHTDINKTTSLLQHRQKTTSSQPHRRKITSLPPHRRNTKTTSLPPHRQQNYKLAATQAQNKTTSLPPHRRITKLQACCHTGIEQNNKLTATLAKNYKLVATKASHKNYKLAATQATELQAYSHTGITQNYTSLPLQRRNTKLQPCRHTGNQTTSLLPQTGFFFA